MVPEIRFNSFGIPYLVEFANVRFRSPSRSSSNARSGSPSPSLNGSVYTHESGITTLASAETASSDTLACPDQERSESGGLYIQFASHPLRPPCKLSYSRVLRLKHRIAKAVLAAGMDSSPTSEVGDPMNMATLSRLSCGSINSTDDVPEDVPGSLYRGTYGQVMTALQAVGLTTTPCKETGIEQATRLGALFVVNRTESGTVELSKLTLWA
ncbi:hypothetical protein AcW1_001083 [Taiwanofungus camphoratus]|nr:hypothetical protein AcW2_000408 [Antrodia cinnamomea]KAI0936988.1 hypothetical protein AcV5_004997 [Antrodia cinnamomea]KAI0964211.1 hypothetical protein AcW1_001083 [Antrodia cinnamomea]